MFPYKVLILIIRECTWHAREYMRPALFRLLYSMFSQFSSKNLDLSQTSLCFFSTH